ncbi:putative metal ion transporter C27B12.12c [Golovinomyces cichoracearum]|uniref:Putative metal ion transporter C27B12.12c n=1 Tax=Golovinomyces cichoracearum TaxID=62708 RepID=A0A420IEU7_9PEZI|nr:putative metal ion transporter C27B12.12c [Golovinomyces cichoracearum]
MPEVVDDSPNPGLSSPAPILHDNITYQTPLAQRPRAKCEITDSTQTDSSLKPSTQDLDSARLEYLPISPRNHEFRGHEEITIVEENDGRASRTDKSRRGTVGNTEIRSSSPPNSVKAFADARRRERELSCSDPSTNKAISDSRRLDEFDLNRAVSRALSRESRRSHRSRRSKRYVTEKEDEEDGATSSNESSKLAEDDVCFPLNSEGNKDSLQIDFGILENFIADTECREKTPTVPQNQPRIFDDLRQDRGDNQVHFTQSGEVLDIPPPSSICLSRKSSVNVSLKNSAVEQERHFENRFEFFSSLGESTIHASEFGDLVLPGDDVRNLFTLSKEDDLGGVWWLNMNNPNNFEIRTICTAFGVHPLTMEDIVTQEAHEKIELFPSYYFACFRSFHVEKIDGGQQYVPFNIYVIVFREGTLSFSFYPNPHATHVRKRITMLKDYVALSSDWICYALIDNIVDSFAPIISKIESETDDIEDEVFIARNDDMHTFLRKIGMVRKNVMGLMKLLGGKADVLRGFTKRCNADYKVTPRMDIGLYLGDIQDHVVTMMASLAHFEKMLSRSHSNYLAQLSIDNITQGNHANKVLSKITLLASILVPLNLVCGMFGMNVKVPWRDAESLGPFFGILGLLSILTIISLYAARRLRFI